MPNAHVIAVRVRATPLFVKATGVEFTQYNSRDRTNLDIPTWKGHAGAWGLAIQRERLRHMVIVEPCAQQLMQFLIFSPKSAKYSKVRYIAGMRFVELVLLMGDK